MIALQQIIEDVRKENKKLQETVIRMETDVDEAGGLRTQLFAANSGTSFADDSFCFKRKQNATFCHVCKTRKSEQCHVCMTSKRRKCHGWRFASQEKNMCFFNFSVVASPMGFRGGEFEMSGRGHRGYRTEREHRVRNI